MATYEAGGEDVNGCIGASSVVADRDYARVYRTIESETNEKTFAPGRKL